MERKKHIREAIIRKRDAMPEEERHEKSLRIAEKIKDLPVYQKAHVLLIYRNFRSEVETEVIFDDAWKRNKTVCAPRVEGNEIRFCQVRSREDFESGVWGIQEPKMSCPVFREAEKGVDIFAILPGTVFDKKGRRIGYGGDIMTATWKEERISAQRRWGLISRYWTRFLLVRLTFARR